DRPADLAVEAAELVLDRGRVEAAGAAHRDAIRPCDASELRHHAGALTDHFDVVRLILQQVELEVFRPTPAGLQEVVGA
ncbi:MAG: hypothetical protein ACK559_34250, partial [bacterium]